MFLNWNFRYIIYYSDAKHDNYLCLNFLAASTKQHLNHPHCLFVCLLVDLVFLFKKWQLSPLELSSSKQEAGCCQLQHLNDPQPQPESHRAANLQKSSHGSCKTHNGPRHLWEEAAQRWFHHFSGRHFDFGGEGNVDLGVCTWELVQELGLRVRRPAGERAIRDLTSIHQLPQSCTFASEPWTELRFAFERDNYSYQVFRFHQLLVWTLPKNSQPSKWEWWYRESVFS